MNLRNTSSHLDQVDEAAALLFRDSRRRSVSLPRRLLLLLLLLLALAFLFPAVLLSLRVSDGQAARLVDGGCGRAGHIVVFRGMTGGIKVKGIYKRNYLNLGRSMSYLLVKQFGEGTNERSKHDGLNS